MRNWSGSNRVNGKVPYCPRFKEPLNPWSLERKSADSSRYALFPPGDDCMDAGCRATQGAFAEGRGEGNQIQSQSSSHYPHQPRLRKPVWIIAQGYTALPQGLICSGRNFGRKYSSAVSISTGRRSEFTSGCSKSFHPRSPVFSEQTLL